MTKEAVIKNLIEHNQWRRWGLYDDSETDDNKPEMLSPKVLGKTIEEAIRLLNQQGVEK